MKKAEQILRERLSLSQASLVGCRRRNLWSEEDKSWRFLKGNALLAVLGEKSSVSTPVGTFEFFILHKRWLLAFRGGQWNDYWMEDFMDLWSVVARAPGKPIALSRTLIVLHENQGELTIREIPMPDFLDPTERYEAIIAELEASPPGRISKGGARAMRTCRYCPVRERCNATDELSGQTTDWSAAYRRDLS